MAIVGRPRILLDTNVWRYVIDAEAESELLRTVVTNKLIILIAPSVLYETIRTPDDDLRQRLVDLMTLKRWKRLMPEAYSECEELRGEIRRLRPRWLRSRPDTGKFRRYRNDWTRQKGGFWDRARNDPGQELNYLRMLGDVGNLDQCRENAIARRGEVTHTDWDGREPLDTIRWHLQSPVDGTRGDGWEAWRFTGWLVTSLALENPLHPYLDWLSPFVDIASVLSERKSWFEFWMYEVDCAKMRSFWMHWAFEHLQRFRSVTSGTPCDAQLASYLLEADVVISADKALLWILDQCRDYSPTNLPRGILIRGGKNGVADLLSHLGSSTFAPPSL